MSETCFKVPRHAETVFYMVFHVGLSSWDKDVGEGGGGLDDGLCRDTSISKNDEKHQKVKIPVPPSGDSMTQAVQVPARESDRKSIVSPSSEGGERAIGARIHFQGPWLEWGRNNCHRATLGVRSGPVPFFFQIREN